jgi:hypothetical protein
MINAEDWNWVVNTDEMTCRNVENGVTIKMVKTGEGLKPVLDDMPMELFAEISKQNDGEKIIEGIVRTAGEKYLEVRD